MLRTRRFHIVTFVTFVATVVSVSFVAAQQDGTFTVTNTRNNFTKTYRIGTNVGTN